MENIIDHTTEDLGLYLKSRGDRAPHEIARTQEICRDLSQFAGRDVHQATVQDFNIYKQLHSQTSEDEEDYRVMLDDIREYCRKSYNEQTTEPVAPRKTAQTPNVNLSGGALDGSEPSSSPSQRDRRRAVTCQCAPDSEIMAFLLDPRTTGVKPDDSQHPQIDAQLGSESVRVSLSKKNASVLDSVSDKMGAATPSANKIVPNRSIDSLEEDLFKTNQRAAEANGRDSISQRFSQFDFSLAGKLEGSEPGFQPSRRPNSGAENASDPNNTFSSFFPPVVDDSPHMTLGGMPEEENIAHQLAGNDMSESLLEEGASPGNNELLRGVSGVDYNFNQANLEIMRRGEFLNARSAGLDKPNPIDPSLVDQHFRSYSFEDKYIIDIPVPEPEKYVCCKQPLLKRWGMSVIPIMGCVLLAILMATFSSVLGAFFFALAALCVVVVLPDMRPSEQQTPFSTLNSYVRARNGRCYGVGCSLLARPAQDNSDLDLMAVWASVVQPWGKSLINRIKPAPLLQMRIAAGSDAQKAMVVLCTLGDDYWLVPLVRLEGSWFVADPIFPKHTIVKSQASSP